MQVSRAFLAVVALAVGTAGLGVLLANPLFLVATALLGAWLLARQLLFARELISIGDAVTVDQSVTPRKTVTDDPLQATLSLATTSGGPLSLSALADPPAAATGSTASERSVALRPGERTATTSFTVRFPVAGEFTFGPPSVVARDPSGLFTETLQRGSAVDASVEPRSPRDVQIGAGGEGIAAGYGQHETGILGTGGLIPEELREYTSGDAARRIDWKATARTGTPQVREYQAETDFVTAIVFDHRAATGIGTPGERPLDYLREVALLAARAAHQMNDPVGCFTVGDSGITGRTRPDARDETYERIRRRLRSLDPTTARTDEQRSMPGPADARRITSRLSDDQFGSTLDPYFAANERYVRRVEMDPLFAAVREVGDRQPGPMRTVILSDDTDRNGIRQAVKHARRGEDHVVAGLAPRTLYEPGGLMDLETAYERYRSFEEFRRSLDRLDRVRALEVVPRNRLDVVLRDHRTERVGSRG